MSTASSYPCRGLCRPFPNMCCISYECWFLGMGPLSSWGGPGRGLILAKPFGLGGRAPGGGEAPHFPDPGAVESAGRGAVSFQKKQRGFGCSSGPGPPFSIQRFPCDIIDPSSNCRPFASRSNQARLSPNIWDSPPIVNQMWFRIEIPF